MTSTLKTENFSLNFNGSICAYTVFYCIQYSIHGLTSDSLSIESNVLIIMFAGYYADCPGRCGPRPPQASNRNCTGKETGLRKI